MKSLRYIFLFIIFAPMFVKAGDKTIYSVDFKKAETFKVSGGVINADYWEVRNDSAIFTSNNRLCNEKGNYRYQVEVTLAADGKLNADDQCIIYIMQNEAIAKSFVVKGSDMTESKKFKYEVEGEKSPVLKVNIVLKSLGVDRAWRLTDNAVSIIAISKDDDPELKVIQHANTSSVVWKCKTTDNHNYFIVERSANGTDFSEAGLVKANRNNQINYYSFVDRTDADTTNYYRIKLKSFNGDEMQYGEIVKAGKEDVANSR